MKSSIAQVVFLLVCIFPINCIASNYEPRALRRQILSDKNFKSGSFLIEISCGGMCTGDFYIAFYFNNANPNSVNYLSSSSEYGPRSNWKLDRRIDNKVISWRKALKLRYSFFRRPRHFKVGCSDGLSYNIHSKIFGIVFERYYDCAATEAFEKGVLKDMAEILFTETRKN